MSFAITSATVRKHISLGASLSAKYPVVPSASPSLGFVSTAPGRRQFLARRSNLLVDRRLHISATFPTAAGKGAWFHDVDQLSVTVAA